MTRTKMGVMAALGAVLAFVVIVVGAYVRLSDAGLGCPDWPGCYGNITAPETAHAVAAANAAFPERPVETAKAWKEMVHRYLAGTLGLVILALAAIAWKGRTKQGLPVVLPSVLVGIVLFQALLGMWTVTLLVKPAVVTAHLLGGLATLSLLWWLALSQLWERPPDIGDGIGRLRPWVWGGLLLVVAQILLGGWTSTNYAALACTEFPTCYGGMWWPPTDFREAFVVWRGLGVNYEYGVLDSAARTAIHLSHRIGALVVLLGIGWLAIRVIRGARDRAHRTLGVALVIVLLGQVGLGIGNVLGQLALGNAVAHSGGAALLLLCLVTLAYSLQPRTDQ